MRVGAIVVVVGFLLLGSAPNVAASSEGAGFYFCQNPIPAGPVYAGLAASTGDGSAEWPSYPTESEVTLVETTGTVTVYVFAVRVVYFGVAFCYGATCIMRVAPDAATDQCRLPANFGGYVVGVSDTPGAVPYVVTRV